jgi:hypothetical protein
VGKNFVVLDIFFMGYLSAEYQISILIFENKLWRGDPYKYPMKNISRTAKFLPIFG